MSPRIWTILLAAGLVSSLGLWSLSYVQVSYASSGALAYAYLEQGALAMHIYDEDPRDGRAEWRCHGYEGLRTRVLPDVSIESDKLYVLIPMWLPSAAFTLALVRRRRSSRASCVACGHDLTPVSEDCPTSGTAGR